MQDTIIITQITCGDTQAEIDVDTGELLLSHHDVVDKDDARQLIEVLKAYIGETSEAVIGQVEMGDD